MSAPPILKTPSAILALFMSALAAPAADLTNPMAEASLVFDEADESTKAAAAKVAALASPTQAAPKSASANRRPKQAQTGCSWCGRKRRVPPANTTAMTRPLIRPTT